MPYDNKIQGRVFLRIVSTTFLILGFMTGLNFLFIFNSIGVSPLSPIQRTIASAPKEDIQLKKNHIITPVIEIDCRETPQNIAINTKASSVRFLFKHCQKVKGLVNQSNNNHSEIFPLDKNRLTSDFVILKNGQNSIKLNWGNKDQIVEITKEQIMPASPDKAL